MTTQYSAKALEKWGQMTHIIERYGDICNFSGVSSVLLPFLNLKYVGTLAPTAKMIGDIPDFNVLNVPKTQPRHNPDDIYKFVFLLILVKSMFSVTVLILKLQCINSLWPSDAILWYRSGSTLAQVMAWCHQAPGYYLNQWWLINGGFVACIWEQFHKCSRIQSWFNP